MNEMFGPEYQSICDRLRDVRRRGRLLDAARWVLSAIAVYTILLLVIVLIEHIGRTDTTARMVMFWVLHGGVVAFLLAMILPALLTMIGLRQGETDYDTAGRVGAYFPGIKDHLLNAMQLVTDESNREKYSPELIGVSFLDVVRRTSGIDFRTILDKKPVKRAAFAAGASALTAIILFLIFPSSLSGALDRLRDYDGIYTPFRLIVEPGDREIVKGESVSITVRIEGTSGDPVVLFAKPERQIEFEQLPLERVSAGQFSHKIRSLGMTTTYYASSGDVSSEEFQLTVLDRPIVRMLRLVVTPPSYTRLASYQPGDNVGDVTALKGTMIRFEAEASKQLEKGSIVFDDGTEHALAVVGVRATGEIRMTRNTGYRLKLTDRENLENSDPVRYSLEVVGDRAPVVRIEVPGTNIDVAGNENLPMTFNVSDDYGIGRLRLAWRLTHSRYERPADQDSYLDIPLPGITTSSYVPFTWPLEDLSLVPEDVITYYAEVVDRDNVSGPNVGRSQSFTLRLPSLEEVFASLDEKHETGLEAMEKILKEVEEVRTEAKKLEEDLRKNQQQAGWEEQKKAGELAERYEEVQKKIEEATTLAEQMIQEMEKNRVVSPETLEKYKELQELLEELNSEELRDAMRRLQESMRDMSPEEIMKAMEQFNITEEQIRKSLERTMNLLKRLQIEQKVDEAIKRMEEMLQEQGELREQTEELQESAQPSDALEAARQQEELASKMEQMQAGLKELQGLMEQFPAEMPLSELDQALSHMDSTALAELMKEISEQMKAMQMAQAAGGQQQTMMSMEQLMEQLQAMQNALQQNMQQAVLNEFRKAYQELLELSQREEAMKNGTAELQRNSPLFRENLGEQMEAMKDLGSVTERLAAVAQKTFGVTPEMGKSIGEAMQQMAKAMESLEARNGHAAATQQEAAMAALNEAAQQVQAGMNAMMQQQGGQGMGMPGLMQQLQSMTGLQQGINQGTRHLGGMGQREAAEMARLAGEQGAVRKSLEQLAREATQTGEMSKLLGDLSKIAQEMREVQTDLARGEIQPQTLQKQDRILSRLLDSQRSMRERDYEKQRKSETATGYTRDRLPGTDLSAEEVREKLRQDLLKALEQGYARDYQAMIRSYFELLEQGERPE